MFSRSHSMDLGADRPQLVGQMDRNSTNAKPSFRSCTLKARRIADFALRTLAGESRDTRSTYTARSWQEISSHIRMGIPACSTVRPSTQVVAFWPIRVV